MVSQCSLIAWLNELASGDQRRHTGSGSALEACSQRCAIQIHAYFTLLYIARDLTINDVSDLHELVGYTLM